MTYTVRIKRAAEKEIEALASTEQTRIRDAIRALASNPRPVGVAKLQGRQNHYRIRIGNYRIVYTIEDRKLVVEVIKVGDRKDVYR